jgi:hypothetical protein
MHSELLAPRSEAWKSCLDKARHDFYHLPDYVELCAESHEGGSPRAFLARDDDGIVLVPLIVRPINGCTEGRILFDAVSPYGYGSPILFTEDGCDRSGFLDRAIESMAQCLRAEHVVTVFCRLHPMLELPLESLRRHGTVVAHGETVFCDLRRSDDELWRATRERLRSRIKKCRSAGFIAEEDTDWNYLDAFWDIYTDTMRRVDATEFYFFDFDYFARLRDGMRQNIHLLVVRSGPEIASAGIFSETCGIVQYHLSGTREAFRQSDTSHLLLHFAREWAKARGNVVYHLGGGVGGMADSLFQFKAGYSKQRSQFNTWRLIVDDEAYRELLASRQIHINEDQPGSGDYFPEYRKYSSVV